jgi:3-methyladenine DNA glycosylase AlkD
MAAKKAAAKAAPKKIPAPAKKVVAPKQLGPKPGTLLDLKAAMAALERHGTAKGRESLARFGIVTKDKVLGVGMKDIQAVAKLIGTNHTLAEALWNTRVYEARMLTAFVANPARVTPAQMDRWAKESDNWAVIDTLCFKLWDQTPHAWDKIVKWTGARPGKNDEWVKRAGFALLASVALHDKAAKDKPFLDGLKRIEAAAEDERNFVKKAVLWALRGIATRNAGLKREAIATAKRLAGSEDSTSRWIGKTALREIAKRG